MKRPLLTASFAALLFPGSALADFAIDGISAVSTESGQMGRFAPAEERGMASFRHSDGELKPRQERYKDAEMLIDLAYTPVTERGSGAATLVEGFADNVPFTTGMAMIIPQGWHVYKDAKLDPKLIPEQISFVGGKYWPNVLKDIGERYALLFHIDWYDRTLMIKKGRPSLTMRTANIPVIAEPKTATAASATRSNDGGAVAFPTRSSPSRPAGSTGTVSSSTTPATKAGAVASSTGTVAIGASSSKPAMVTAGGASASSASSGAASAARHPAPQQTQLSGASPTAASTSRSAATAPMRRSWNAYRGSTLRATVTDWCRISGFELEWVPFDLDYPIASPLHFEGSFEQAVFDLFHLYEKADRSFLVDGYTKGQKRLVITENKKSSKGVHQ